MPADRGGHRHTSNGTAPLHVQFDASGSSDPEGDTLSYSWDLNGDGTFGDSTAVKPSHDYTTTGTYDVAVRVTDSHGASDTLRSRSRSETRADVAQITSPQASVQWAVGDSIAFAGDATDDQGTLPDSAFHWQVILNHCPSNCHEHPLQSIDDVRSGWFTAPDHDYPSSLTIKLTVTDGGGLSDSDWVTSTRVRSNSGSSPRRRGRDRP